MSGDQPISLTVAELETITKNAVKQAFIEVGIAASDPIEMQKDFAFIRDLRVATSSMRRNALVTLVGVLIPALLTLMVLGIKSYFFSGGK